MKKLLTFFIGLVFAGVASAASIKEDITSQGNTGYLHKSISAQQLATMVRDYEDVTAVKTLTYLECGKTVFLNSATEFAVTLPLPIAGCEFTFIVKAAPSGANYTVVTSGGADILIGMVTAATADDLGQADANADVITFVGGQSVVGDWVRVFSDGTSWYFSGAAFVAEGITSGTT